MGALVVVVVGVVLVVVVVGVDVVVVVVVVVLGVVVVVVVHDVHSGVYANFVKLVTVDPEGVPQVTFKTYVPVTQLEEPPRTNW